MAIKDLKLADPVSSVLTAANMRAGSVAVTSLLTSVAVTFSSALPDANYLVFLYMGGVAVAFTVSNVATTGFTVGFSAGLSGTLNYLAVPIL